MNLMPFITLRRLLMNIQIFMQATFPIHASIHASKFHVSVDIIVTEYHFNVLRNSTSITLHTSTQQYYSDVSNG